MNDKYIIGDIPSCYNSCLKRPQNWARSSFGRFKLKPQPFHTLVHGSIASQQVHPHPSIHPPIHLSTFQNVVPLDVEMNTLVKWQQFRRPDSQLRLAFMRLTKDHLILITDSCISIVTMALIDAHVHSDIWMKRISIESINMRQCWNDDLSLIIASGVGVGDTKFSTYDIHKCQLHHVMRVSFQHPILKLF